MFTGEASQQQRQGIFRGVHALEFIKRWQALIGGTFFDPTSRMERELGKIRHAIPRVKPDD